MFTFKNFRNVYWHGKTHSAMMGLWFDANSTLFAGTFNSCIVLARLPFQKALSALQQFNLKQNTMHRSLARPRISPVRGGEQNFFSLQQSLCPWPGVAGCEQHEYVDCIKPSHHALPAIKHKNRKISRKLFASQERVVQIVWGRIAGAVEEIYDPREESHLISMHSTAVFPIFWYRTLSHA